MVRTIVHLTKDKFIDFTIDISSLNDFNVDKSTTLTPVDVDKTFNLLDKSISCPPVDASVKVDADAKAHAVASIGVAATGTILPPEVTSFSLVAGTLYFGRILVYFLKTAAPQVLLLTWMVASTCKPLPRAH